MYKSSIIFMKTQGPHTLFEVASQIWARYMHHKTEYIFDYRRASAGFPTVSYMTPKNDLYFVVSGDMKVKDNLSVIAWKGNSFTIEIGEIEKDKLRSIINELQKELGL